MDYFKGQLAVIWEYLAPYRIALGLALFAAANVGSLYSGYRVGTHLKQGEWDAAVIARQAGEAAALRAAADAIAKIEVKSEQIIQPLKTEIRTNTVYRECSHSPDSLRNLNTLITGSEPSGLGVLPIPNPTR